MTTLAMGIRGQQPLIHADMAITTNTERVQRVQLALMELLNPAATMLTQCKMMIAC